MWLQPVSVGLLQKRKAAKSRDEDLSDSADEDYETDGEEDLKRNRLQKAKRLADSDDNSSDDEVGLEMNTLIIVLVTVLNRWLLYSSLC